MISVNILTSNTQSMHFKQPFAPIKLKSVTESEIYEINKSLKWKTLYRYDEVPSWIVKLSMPFI